MKKIILLVSFEMLLCNLWAQTELNLKFPQVPQETDVRIYRPINGLYNSSYAAKSDRYTTENKQVTTHFTISQPGFIGLSGKLIDGNFRLFLTDGDSVALHFYKDSVHFEGTNARGYAYYRKHQYDFFYIVVNANRSKRQLQSCCLFAAIPSNGKLRCTSSYAKAAIFPAATTMPC